MSINLKCPNRSRHAILFPEDGYIEFKCDRSFCGAGPGKVVLHRFSLTTGELIKTQLFAEPMKGK